MDIEHALHCQRQDRLAFKQGTAGLNTSFEPQKFEGRLKPVEGSNDDCSREAQSPAPLPSCES